MKSPFIVCAALAVTIAAFPVMVVRGGGAILRYPPAKEAQLNTVCWTGTLFVAGGHAGRIFTSPDGTAWTERQSPVISEWFAGAAGGGQIVLCGNDKACVTSPDGITWTSRTIPDTVSFLAWNGSAFAGISGNTTFFSPDGITWTQEQTGSGGNLTGLAVRDSQFATFSPGSAQQLLTSTGGPWTGLQTNTQDMLDLVWTGSRYAAAGKVGAAATSTDGVTWTARSTGVTTELKDIISNGTLAVAVGAGGTVITSPNGAAWTVQSSGTLLDLNAVSWSGTSFVAVGARGVVLSSPDGAAWTTVNAGASRVVDPLGLAWMGTTGIAVGRQGTLVSSDGNTWTPVVTANHPFTALGSNYFPDRFRAATGAGRIAAAAVHNSGLWTYHLDAPAWTPIVALPGNADGMAVIWDGRRFVVLTREDPVQPSFYNFIRTSPDGVVWSQPAKASGIGYPGLNDLVWTGQRYVTAYGWSSDLVSWTNSDSQGCRWIFWTGSKLIGVLPDGRIVTSANGDAWVFSQPTPFRDFRDVTWTGSRLLAMSGGQTFESGTSGPWTPVIDIGGLAIVWQGDRALVSTGREIFSLEGVLTLRWGEWLSEYFTPVQLSDPAIAGPMADPDHDKQPNLVEYALGTNPVNSADAPVVTVHPSPQGVRFRWPLDTSRIDVAVKPQTSFDLSVWDDTSSTPVQGPEGGVRIMETPPLIGQREAFFRLKVTLLD